MMGGAMGAMGGCGFGACCGGGMGGATGGSCSGGMCADAGGGGDMGIVSRMMGEVVQIEIPQGPEVNFLIGKGGGIIRQFEEATGTRIQGW